MDPCRATRLLKTWSIFSKLNKNKQKFHFFLDFWLSTRSKYCLDSPTFFSISSGNIPERINFNYRAMPYICNSHLAARRNPYDIKALAGLSRRWRGKEVRRRIHTARFNNNFLLGSCHFLAGPGGRGNVSQNITRKNDPLSTCCLAK